MFLGCAEEDISPRRTPQHAPPFRSVSLTRAPPPVQLLGALGFAASYHVSGDTLRVEPAQALPIAAAQLAVGQPATHIASELRTKLACTREQLFLSGGAIVYAQGL